MGLNDDGLTNYCTWNAADGPIRGVDVAQAMLDIAASPAFSSRTDTEFLAGVQDGSIIAGISGVWNAVAIQEVWGEDMGAARLPTYTCAGQDARLEAKADTGSQNLPPTRWSWENSDWARSAAMAGEAWTSGEAAARTLAGPCPRSCPGHAGHRRKPRLLQPDGHGVPRGRPGRQHLAGPCPRSWKRRR